MNISIRERLLALKEALNLESIHLINSNKSVNTLHLEGQINLSNAIIDFHLRFKTKLTKEHADFLNHIANRIKFKYPLVKTNNLSN